MKKLLIPIFILGSMLAPQMSYAQTDTSGRETPYRATHTKSTELRHTKLKVSFDYQKEQMSGEEWLTASPYFYPTDSLVLDAKGMLIHEVALDQNGTKSSLKFDYRNDQLKINLGKTYTRNQNYTVYIKYTARPNEVQQKGSAAITDAKGLYFINPRGEVSDKPTQIWTQGETESSSAWFPTIDKPNQKTTQEIYMTVPDKYVTLSNGVLTEQKKDSNGLRTDHWVMEKKHAPYLFFMGVGDYAIVKDKWRNIPVDYYVEKEYAPYAKQIFGNTPEMMEFFSKKLNYDFPWPKYAQIVGRDYVSGAMENTTATLHGESANQKPGDLIDENKWEDVIAHELFHQWFGDLVTTESWSNITVNESFANYSEYLWNEYKYGKDFADYHLKKDIEGYKMDPSNYSKDLVRFNYQSREDVFDGVSYNKGGGVLHMLRNYLGDEAFFGGLNDYLRTNEYGTGEAHQLRLSLEKVSGKDLNWFFNQWYYGSGNPKLGIKYNYEPVKKQVSVSVDQFQTEKFEFPLNIDVYEGGTAKRYQVWANAKDRNIFTFDYKQKPELINVNPDGLLISDVTDDKSPEEYAYQYSHAKDFFSRNQAVEYAEKNPAATSTSILIAALKDPFFRLRIAAIKALDLTKKENSKAISQIESMATQDSKTLVQAAAIGALAKLKDQKYIPLFEKGLRSVSNAVKGSSVAAIGAVDPSKVASLAVDLDLSNASEDVIMTLMPAIVKNKITAQMPHIAQVAAFYPFIKFQNPELGPVAEEAYHWIMSSDNLKATENVTKVLSQVKSQIGNNPQAKMMISQILNDGLSIKMEVLKANPESKTIHQQVDALNTAINLYK